MSIDLAFGIYGTAPRTSDKPLTGQDLEAAHQSARDVLAVEVPAERAVWTSQAIALLVGGLAPAIGAAGFHWTLGPILLAIAIDDAAAVAADLVKLLLGERAFTQEVERRRVAANTWTLARWTAGTDGLPLSWSPHPRYERPAMAVLYFYGLMGALLTGTFLAIVLMFVDLRALAGWPLLFLPLLTRLLPAARVALRARAGRPSPEIMPSGWLPASASLLAIMFFLTSGNLRDDVADPLAYAACYFAVCALFAALLTWSRRRHEAGLRRFADSDIGLALAALRKARYGSTVD